MSLFCITRDSFLDRVFDVDELTALTEMLRYWFQTSAAGRVGRSGDCRCEARIYAFPRSETEAIRQRLQARSRQAAIDTADPDQLVVTGPSTPVTAPADVGVWRQILSDPQLQHACVMLRFTIRGSVFLSAGRTDATTTTVVLCGAPAGSGAMLVKAIWPLGADESMHQVFRAARWDSEFAFLEAFETFLGGMAAGDDRAAERSLQMFIATARHDLFMPARREWLVMRLTRLWVELPDDRGPLALIRRLMLPLLGAGIAIAPAIAIRQPLPLLVAISSVIAAYLLLSAARIVWKKFERVQRYYTVMRAGLGKLYAGPVTYQQIDLSSDRTPTLLKFSAELAALGARHICDVRIDTARSVLDGNRIFTLGNASLALGLLRKTENLHFFPAKPVLMMTTRFKDGRRHYTVNTPRYRKRVRADTTARCLLEEGAADELVALHRRYVDDLIRAGAVPLTPPTTPQQVMDQMRAEYEISRAAWNESPYSWSDALHEAFKICRREYRPD